MSHLSDLIRDLCAAKVDAELIGRVADLAVFGPAGGPTTEPVKEVAAEPVYRPPELAAKADMWATAMKDDGEQAVEPPADPGAVPGDHYGLRTSND